MMARGMLSFLVALVLAAACTSSSPKPTETASVASAIPLSVLGSGTVSCTAYDGCRAALSILPAGRSPVPTASDDAALEFQIQSSSTQGMGTWDLVGPLKAGPASVEAGVYTLVGQIDLVSDIASPGFSLRPVLSHLGSCTADLTVSFAAAHINVLVAFDGHTCRISVS